MPSQASGNKGGKGGAITMETTDHKVTASCDNQPGSREYREAQKKLVGDGKFKEAFEMDVKDIRSRYGDKYDEAIKDLEKYYQSIGKIQ